MDLKHSMSGGGPQAPQPQQERSPLEQVSITSQHTDQLNQHMLLTVQSINRLQSIFTTRGS